MRNRSWQAVAYVASSLVGVALIAAAGSPWVDAKAFATASPAVLFAALLAYDPQASADENLVAMAAAAEQVVSGEVTRAVRDATSPVEI